MLEISLDENKIEELLLTEIHKKIEKIQAKLTFWDLDELSKQTCMSIGNIKDKFFYDADFPKYKVGGKWYFPAEECAAFLLQWLKSQPKN
jgi:hypothetical protein